MSAFSLLFLGTGAADFSPAMQEIRDRLDKNLRRSSSLLVNGSILIDCGPHVPESLHILGIPAQSITDLFLTHLHDDHCDLDNICRLAACRETPLRIHYLRSADMPAIPGALMMPLDTFRAQTVQGVTVTALPANHTQSPVHYLFETQGKRFVYGTDGAWMLYDTLYYLKGMNLDAYIFDSTVGDYEGDLRMAEHNSLPMIRSMTASMRTVAILKPDSRLLLTHIARTLTPPHEEYALHVAKEGFELAYDGLRVEL